MVFVVIFRFILFGDHKIYLLAVYFLYKYEHFVVFGGQGVREKIPFNL